MTHVSDTPAAAASFFLCVPPRSVVAAFRGYAADAEAEIARWEANYAQLSPRHKCVRRRGVRTRAVRAAGGGFAHASPRAQTRTRSAAPSSLPHSSVASSCSSSSCASPRPPAAARVRTPSEP